MDSNSTLKWFHKNAIYSWISKKFHRSATWCRKHQLCFILNLPPYIQSYRTYNGIIICCPCVFLRKITCGILDLSHCISVIFFHVVFVILLQLFNTFNYVWAFFISTWKMKLLRIILSRYCMQNCLQYLRWWPDNVWSLSRLRVRLFSTLYCAVSICLIACPLCCS